MALSITQQDMDIADAIRFELSQILLGGVSGATPTPEINGTGSSQFNIDGLFSTISSPPTEVPSNTLDFLQSIALVIIRATTNNSSTSPLGPFPVRLPVFTNAQLPAAALWIGGVAFSSSSGLPVFSNGINWVLADGTVIV